MSIRRKILVADHDTARTNGLRNTFSAHGWHVLLARDAVSATAAALRERPDVMILSRHLPGGGGLVTLRRARASVHTAGIPVIAIAGPQEGDWSDFRREGADACLPPDAEEAAVVACVQRLVGDPAPTMEAPASIIRHPDRLASLDGTGLLDSAPSEPFDTLTRMASSLLSVPVALVSLVDKERQFFKSSIGLSEPWASRRETPLTHSFCQWVVSDHSALVVDDARAHPVLRDNRALHELGVVAYAGMPLATNSGEAIGSFCAIDTKPHPWSQTETDLLRELSKVAEALIALAELDASQDRGRAATENGRILRSLATRAVARGISASAGILRRDQPRPSDRDRESLIGLIDWLGQQLAHLGAA